MFRRRGSTKTHPLQFTEKSGPKAWLEPARRKPNRRRGMYIAKKVEADTEGLKGDEAMFEFGTENFAEENVVIAFPPIRRRRGSPIWSKNLPRTSTSAGDRLKGSALPQDGSSDDTVGVARGGCRFTSMECLYIATSWVY